MRIVNLVLPGILFGLWPAAACGADLVAGPMVGHVSDRSARVWMQFPVAGEVAVTTYDTERATPVSSLRMTVEGPTPFVCDVPVGGLAPNRTYRMEVRFNGEAVRLATAGLIIRTAPPAGEQDTFTVAFGSGLNVSPMAAADAAGTATGAPTAGRAPGGFAVFREIAALKPRAFLFLGNTGRLPPVLEQFPLTHREAFRFLNDFHSQVRRVPELQPLLRTTPCYGILGDRDFGTLGADSRFVFAAESLVAFQRFWPNPDWGTPGNPGCFSRFSIGDIDFFLLDTRTFRNEGVTTASPTMLGEAQLDWLKKGLAASRASFKFLSASCALWGDNAAGPERNADSWARFPPEQAAFIRWLSENRIDGVIALAGNQAAGGLSHVEAAATGLKYPLLSVGVSTFGGGAEDAAATFGTLDFGGLRERRFVTLRVRDAGGKVQSEQTVFATQLRH